MPTGSPQSNAKFRFLAGNQIFPVAADVLERRRVDHDVASKGANLPW